MTLIETESLTRMILIDGIKLSKSNLTSNVMRSVLGEKSTKPSTPGHRKALLTKPESRQKGQFRFMIKYNTDTKT